MARLDYAGSTAPAGPDGEIIDRIRARRSGALRSLVRVAGRGPLGARR